MSKSANPLALRTALERAFGGRRAALAALTARGIPQATGKAWLSAEGRGLSVAALERLLALVPDPVRFLADLGFAAGQPWVRALWRGAALDRVVAAHGALRLADHGAPASLAAQVRALAVAPVADYWVTPQGVSVAEQGLEYEAAMLLEEPDPTGLTDRLDYPGMARRFLGAISVTRQPGHPTRIGWDASAVSPLALAHLLAALPRWDADAGGDSAYRFDHQLSDGGLVVPGLVAALAEVERALGIARLASGAVQSPHLAAEELSLDRAGAPAAALLALWRDHGTDPAGFAARLPQGAEGFCCLYGLGDQGLITRHHGFDLPPILGVPWDRLAGVPTALEPAHPDYRALYLHHLLTCARDRRPKLHRVRGRIGGLSGGYTRVGLPLVQAGRTVGLLTFSYDIGGVECLSRLAS